MVFIEKMERAIDFNNQNLFSSIFSEYINTFGKVYKKKQQNIFSKDANVDYIVSHDDDSQIVTPLYYDKLCKVIQRALDHNDWKSKIIIILSVFDLQKSIFISQKFTLSEIQAALQHNQQLNYRKIVLIAGSFGLALALGSYYFAQQNSQLIEQGSNVVKDSIEDTYEGIARLGKYFFNTQNYESFEKEHGLLSYEMTTIERLQRFKEWQTGESIQQRHQEQLKQVQRFERNLHLPSEDMSDQDRIAIFKEWQRQNRYELNLDKKLIPVKKFEKEHGLISENLDKEERLNRYKEWQRGDRDQKKMIEKMKSVKAFENRHDLLSDDITEDQRLIRFQEWQRGDKAQQELHKNLQEIEAFEKELDLPSNNMILEDRYKILQEYKQEQAHEKLMKNVEKHKRWKSTYYRSDRPLTEEERLYRYYHYIDPLHRYAIENDLISN
ncbi:MAG: hypothetical protein K2X69_16975 [Silvanigrellaceae bacterium]|nr:hypothetical protein [Silvanigrellaceae bacterium]